MSTSGEEHATHDSEVWGEEIVEGEIRDIEWPQQHIEVGEIYEHLSPESANRILSMVEREQQYEERTVWLEFWLRTLGRLAAAAGAVAAIAGLILVGFHNKSAQTGLASVTSFVAGGAAVYAATRSFAESRRPKIRVTFRSRDDETSDDSHQDVR